MIAAMSQRISHISGLRATLAWAMLQKLLQQCPQHIPHISGWRVTWCAPCCRDCQIVGSAAFGVFVEVLPGMTGLVHVTEMSDSRVDLNDFREGMSIDIKVLEVGDLLADP